MSFKSLGCIAIFLFFCASAFGQSVAQKSSHIIAGKVTDKDCHKTINKATVHMVGSDGSTRDFKTDTSGSYYIDSMFVKPLTSYVLTISGLDVCYLPANDYKYRFTLSAQAIPAIYNFEMTHVTDCPGCIRFPTIRFDFNSTAITQGAKDTDLSWMVKIMNGNPTVVIELDGHASQNEGDTTQKKALALNRAQACKDYMFSIGVDSARMLARGWSDAKPLIDKITIRRMKTKAEKDDAYAINRRVAFRVLRFNYAKKP